MSTLVLGDKGPEVGDVHQLLLEVGESVDPGELSQSFFGPSTRVAVLDFQAAHVDAQGHPLVQDGVVGPRTRAALADPHGPLDRYIMQDWRGDAALTSPAARPVVLAAIGEIGTCEEPLGSNRGPKVDIYNGPDNLGFPWCANFASWCWSHADGGSPFGKLASVIKIRDWGARHGHLIGAIDRLLPGDIWGILRTDGHGHCGLVTAPELSGESISSVEGNCSNSVRGTTRPRAQLTFIVRPT